MELFPAIDLIGGCAVRLVKGDYAQKTVYSENPAEVAKSFAAAGAKYLHVVDLEGAKDGGTPNLETIKNIVEKGGLLMLALFAAGCLAMLHKALAWPGLLLLAWGMGIYTTLLPQVTRRVFGSREYASIWSLISTVGCAGTFVANPIWGTIYDLTGTYTLGLVGAAVLLAGAMWAHLLTLKDVT